MKAGEFDKRFDEGEDISEYLDLTKAECAGTGRFGLDPRALRLIRGVFRMHAEVQEVRIYGSRSTGHFEKQSDVDLALWGDVDRALIARIMAELDELPLPYTFDVQAYDSINHEPLKRHIDEVSKVLYSSEELEAPR
jgi:predicted nucleotidyltransferase